MNNSEEIIKVKIGDIFLTKSEYNKTEILAEELGMTNVTQYCKYSMLGIMEAHYPDQEWSHLQKL
jgi:hypothetical protein